MPALGRENAVKLDDAMVYAPPGPFDIVASNTTGHSYKTFLVRNLRIFALS
jgi:hypothetical protein